VRVLVTGGTGYLGRVIIDRYAVRDDDVHALWHRQAASAASAAEGITWHRSELADRHDSRALVARLQPDLVVHTAYSMTTDGDVVNGSAPGDLATASRAVGARFVHLSTDVVFDGTRGDYREDDPVHPITPYGQAKELGERLVREADPDALIVRTSLLYAGATPGPQEQLVARALDGDDDLAFFTDEVRSVAQVDDVADAVVELADRPTSGVVHVAGADAITRHEFARLLARSAGRDPDRLRGARSGGLDPPRPLDCTLDCTRARQLLTHTRLRGVHEVLGAT
jgi:dTDP-4-dehydrorhamnose reductase